MTNFFQQLQFEVQTGNEEGHFKMTTMKSGSKYLGVISVAKPLDRETKGLFKFNVRL